MICFRSGPVDQWEKNYFSKERLDIHKKLSCLYPLTQYKHFKLWETVYPYVKTKLFRRSFRRAFL